MSSRKNGSTKLMLRLPPQGRLFHLISSFQSLSHSSLCSILTFINAKYSNRENMCGFTSLDCTIGPALADVQAKFKLRSRDRDRLWRCQHSQIYREKLRRYA
ncbi:uncharacterized protein FOMMEDRAFT_137771 [Fomitiporia mediterranea MF3/22]|uniref:uncharacterized protein n=1 Tax=Fomitiporia mediterranea (strain MF3/22) TaxID=694068 RepID=UPI0004409811|nr:uncharacterized protein FOMMEDRAFT_137771 [Fomitiporia mediterranea MF3/22]EJD07462.1 hypothetical protein FOMMEDRAFT_137771 [Fomitiporia mediterranea MF3/22]